ncbi:MAG: hypothetical protein ABJH20_11440, partial [Rhizobiaceae bacterium]
YRFKYPRDEEIKTGCMATFTVTYRGEPGSTLIGFSLVDYELAVSIWRNLIVKSSRPWPAKRSKPRTWICDHR